MNGNSNLETARSIYSGWSGSRGGTAAEILELFDDDVEMHSALSADIPDPVAGVQFGKTGAQAYFDGLLRDWEMLNWEVGEYIDGGDTIVVLSRCAWRNRATGKVCDTPKIDVLTFRNGKVIRFQEAYDTLGFARALGAV